MVKLKNAMTMLTEKGKKYFFCLLSIQTSDMCSFSDYRSDIITTNKDVASAKIRLKTARG